MNYYKNYFYVCKEMLFKLIYRLDSKAGTWRYDGGQNTASDMNYHCRIDNDIEVAMLKK